MVAKLDIENAGDWLGCSFIRKCFNDLRIAD